MESAELKKLRQLVFHFNNNIANLKNRFAILESMNDEGLIKSITEKSDAYIYSTIRHSLLLSCTIDIAVLAKDSNPRSLSIKNIMDLINAPQINLELLKIKENSNRKIHFAGSRPSDETIEMLYKEQTDKRINLYKNSLTNLKVKLENESLNNQFIKLWEIRNKVAAHKDIINISDKYVPFSSSEINITLQDLRKLISELESFNKLFHAVVEATDVSWESFESDLRHSIKKFWRPFHDYPSKLPK
jgi:hypothetical protein